MTTNIENQIAALSAQVDYLTARLEGSGGSLNIYKSYGAAQFRVLPPRFNDRGHLQKAGAILIEAAPGDGNKKNPTWDWNKKITFSLSPGDIMSIMGSPDNVDIFHSHNDTPKKLRVEVSTGNYGGYMLNLSTGKGDSRSSVGVPLTDGEWAGLLRMCVSQLNKLTGWA
jgi:hypothetical protein